MPNKMAYRQPDGAAQVQSHGVGDQYAIKVRACIRQGVPYRFTSRKGLDNPTVGLRASLLPDGTVAKVLVTHSSGLRSLDEAVRKGSQLCSPFPLPPVGEYPSYVDLIYRMYQD